MPFATQVACGYNANALGCKPTDLLAALIAVPLDLDYMAFLGLSLLSDTNSLVAPTAKRVITLALNAPPFVPTFNNNDHTKAPYTGAIRSSSPKDKNVTGSGAREVTIFYKDGAGNPQTNIKVGLNGEEWVALPTSDHAIITDVQLVTVGADQANDGVLSIATGLPVIPIPGGFTPAVEVVGQVPASFYTQANPLGVDPELVTNWMLLKLQEALGMPIVAVTPVFS